MGWFDNDSDQAQAYQQSTDPDNQPKFTHELAAGGAAFYAAREYEKHCEANGKPESHQKAKELLAGFAGAFFDREVEPRAENAYDREKVKRDAVKHCQDNGLDDQFDQQGGGGGYDQGGYGGGYGGGRDRDDTQY